MHKSASGSKEFLPGIGRVEYEGKESRNPLAYRWYDENRLVGGKTMKEYLRFSVAYWHSFGATGEDPFGSGTRDLAWNNGSDSVSNGKAKMDAAFEFITKLGIPFYCFHDFDPAEEGDTIAESDRRMQIMVDHAKEHQEETGVRLLWGTSNLFSHKRYMNGAVTTPDFSVIAYAGTQVKRAIDMTVALAGDNYVLWAAARAI